MGSLQKLHLSQNSSFWLINQCRSEFALCPVNSSTAYKCGTFQAGAEGAKCTAKVLSLLILFTGFIIGVIGLGGKQFSLCSGHLSTLGMPKSRQDAALNEVEGITVARKQIW